MTQLLFVLGAYLLGSISFGIVVSRAMGLPDPSTYGSGNPGATNVLRTGKKSAALLTLAGDAAKGWLAVWLALHFGLPPLWVAVVGAAVFLGHLYPVYYQFKGGKGVATALGVLLALSPWLGLAVLLVWVLVFAVWRYSSLAALVAAALAPLYAFWQFGAEPRAWLVLLMAALLIWRHKSNIRKLLAGEESGFGRK